MKRIAPALILAGALAAFAHAEPTGNANDWLLGAESDTARFQRLQTYLRGFDQPMWEVGERFQRAHDALADKNYDLARYHWEKIKVTIENGYMKRPARRTNADALFLSTAYIQTLKAIETKDAAKAWEGFAAGRAACIACHEAEKVGFINDQSLFRRTGTPH